MSAIDYARARDELSCQLANARQLVKFSGLERAGATVEAALDRLFWIYLLQNLNRYEPGMGSCSMLDYDNGTLNFGGSKCFEDDDKRNWTEDEKKLGFAVKLKIPSVIRIQPPKMGR